MLPIRTRADCAITTPFRRPILVVGQSLELTHNRYCLKQCVAAHADVAPHFAYYNFCRVHSSLRITPAMEAGLTDHVWSIAELLNAA